MADHYQFRALILEEQLTLVWTNGTYLARRYEEEDAVNLYHMSSFFCEVYYDQHAETIVRTRAFTSVNCLENYTCYINLSDLSLL